MNRPKSWTGLPRAVKVRLLDLVDLECDDYYSSLAEVAAACMQYPDMHVSRRNLDAISRRYDDWTNEGLLAAVRGELGQLHYEAEEIRNTFGMVT